MSLRKYVAGAIIGASLTSAAAHALPPSATHTLRPDHGERVRIVLPPGTHEDETGCVRLRLNDRDRWVWIITVKPLDDCPPADVRFRFRDNY